MGSIASSRTMTSVSVARCINESLPDEVFGVIFEEHAKLEWKAPLIDGQVCHQWRQTILCSPRAWAHLRISHIFSFAPSQLDRWLDRSGSVPLHIQAIDWTRDIEEVLDDHSNRIQSISLDDISHAFLQNRSFPILQSLTIDGMYNDTLVIHWSACSAMPALRSLRASYMSMGALLSNIFPTLKLLALNAVNDCDSIIRNTSHSLTSLMLSWVSLQDTSETLEFPSLRFLSLLKVKNVKHRMNVPALITYHEADEMDEESFPVSLPLLTEYGICQHYNNSPLNVTKLHQCYPNISRLSIGGPPSTVKLFLHSLSGQPGALLMLQILAVDGMYSSTTYSREDKESLMNDASVRNMASSVKMELCFDGGNRFPLYFAPVRVYINNGQSKLTFTLRTFPNRAVVICSATRIQATAYVFTCSDSTGNEYTTNTL